ncbi:MAG: cytochrome P450 [Sciscionella sp.]
MTDSATQQAPAFPLPRTCPFDPPAEYGVLREQAPVSVVTLLSGQRAWVVTTHSDVRSVLSDPRFSSDRSDPDFPVLVPRGRINTDFSPSLLGMDPPEHGPARKAVVGEFTVRRMEALRPRVQQIVDERIDAMLAGGSSADLVHALALPVPSLVICELLGVPYADHEFFQGNSATLLRHTEPPEQRGAALRALLDYLNDLVTAKQADPGDDLLGRQVLKQRESGRADHEALVSLAFLLLLAGHETTANMISLGTLALLREPGQLAALVADSRKTLPAVEELLRYFTIADTVTLRVATQDVRLGDETIAKGDGVLVLGLAGNRDPQAFPRPDALDIERGARNHVAFGFGAHQCLGQNLARLELQVVFDTLFARIPTLRIGLPVAELSFKRDATIYGLHELPVSW